MSHPYNFQNDVTDGFKLCVTMQSTVPSEILCRHGERCKVIPVSDSNLSVAHAIWIPQVSSEFDFLDVGASMASPIGPIPLDGGDLLPYLIQARMLIEKPLVNKDSLIELFDRIKRIRNLRMGHKYILDTNFKLVESPELIDYFDSIFHSEQNVFNLLLNEHNILSLSLLSFAHITQLMSLGYNSINSIVRCDDSVLLALPRMGKKTLEKFRLSIKS